MTLTDVLVKTIRMAEEAAQEAKQAGNIALFLRYQAEARELKLQLITLQGGRLQ